MSLTAEEYRKVCGTLPYRRSVFALLSVQMRIHGVGPDYQDLCLIYLERSVQGGPHLYGSNPTARIPPGAGKSVYWRAYPIKIDEISVSAPPGLVPRERQRLL